MPLTRAGAATLLAISLVCGSASAETFPWDEYKKRLQSAQEVGALKSDLFGDQVNLSNGGLSFSATDVALPGNGPLAVAFTRTYSVENQYERVTDRMLADWDLDVPHISATFAPDWAITVPGQPWKRCSAPAHQAMPPTPVWDLPYFEFWQGNQMSLPGGAGGELLRIPSGAQTPSTGGPYHWMTTSQTYVSCLTSIKNQAGAEGFLAITADGTRYWFDWLAQNFEPNLSSPVGGSYIQRRRNVLYATKVEDRFGNVVEYQYVNLNGSWNSPARLVSVSSSDGRTLSVTRNASGHIESPRLQ